MIVGAVNNFALETSYASAAKNLNCDVVRFDPQKEILKYIEFGKIGKLLDDFLPVVAWSKKMNRDLIIKVKEEKPGLILLVGGSKILYGTLITIKVIHPACKLAWVWPDTPANLNANNLSYAKVVDLSAIYSKSTIEIFRALGFENPLWLPLAGDLTLHWNELNTSDDFDCDISFVGMWRPEREKVLKVIIQKFDRLKIEIIGKYWKRNCVDKGLLSKWKGEALFANDLANYFNRSRINLNIIDDTNYPAANMRFFEIPTAGGLQLCSSCPEFRDEFVDKRDVLYFENEDQLIEKTNWILTHKNEVGEIRKAAQQKIKNSHNYSLRLESIMNALNLS